jgi:hypothetical protein
VKGREFYAFHEEAERRFLERHPDFDPAAAYAMEQSPLEPDEQVTAYEDRRGA